MERRNPRRLWSLSSTRARSNARLNRRTERSRWRLKKMVSLLMNKLRKRDDVQLVALDDTKIHQDLEGEEPTACPVE